jgi:hypothetical protein
VGEKEEEEKKEKEDEEEKEEEKGRFGLQSPLSPLSRCFHAQ